MNLKCKPKFQCLSCIVILFALAAVLSGCGLVMKSSEPVEEKFAVQKLIGPKQTLGIPYGHLPPPGLCRIWFPNRPPGHQSDAGQCHLLMSNVLPGAWLLTRTESNPSQIQVTVFDRYEPSDVIAIRYYIAETGKFDYEEDMDK